MIAAGTVDELRTQGADLLKQGKYDAAIAALREAADQDSGDEAVWRLLGATYSAQNTPTGHQKAEDAFGRALRLAPAAGRNYFNLAVAQLAAGKPDEARKNLEKTLILEPNHEQAKVRLHALTQAEGAATTAPAPQNQATPQTGGLTGGAPTGGMAGLSGVGSIYAPPQPESTGTTNLGGGNLMGLSSVGADKGYVAPAPAATVAPPPAPVLGGVGGSASANVPSLKPAAAQPGAPTGSLFYDQMSRAESNAYLAGAYMQTNTSGMQGSVPPDVAKGFNLGAAVFPFWWLRNHNLRPIGIGIGIAYSMIRVFGQSVNPFGVELLIGFLQVVMFLVMGFMGNRIAWQNRKFDDEEDCLACQRTWMWWAVARIALEPIHLYIAYQILQTAASATHLGGGSGIGQTPNGF